MRFALLMLGTWNVRAMTPGLSDNLQDISATRKRALINWELSRLQMDIVALQEIRIPGSGSVRERDFTFFW